MNGERKKNFVNVSNITRFCSAIVESDGGHILFIYILDHSVSLELREVSCLLASKYADSMSMLKKLANSSSVWKRVALDGSPTGATLHDGDSACTSVRMNLRPCM